MNRIKLVTIISISIFLAAGCADKRGAGAFAARTSVPVPTADGTAGRGDVLIPTDSPLRTQLKLETVAAAALPGDLVVAPGRIEFDPSRVGKIVLPVAGRIESVLVAIGDRVAAGQPLFSIDSPDAGAAVSEYRQAQASVSQAKSSLAKAEADHDRATELFDHKAIARKDLLVAENELVQAQTTLAQNEAALDHCGGRLKILGISGSDNRNLVMVKAPRGGKIIDLSVTAGEYCNDTTTPVMTVADLGVVWVTSSVPENMIRYIEVGEEIELEMVAFPGETFKARVKRIADTLDPKTRTVQVRAELANPAGRFKPEMFGTIRHSHPVTPCPVVPEQAILRRGGESLVYVERVPGTFSPVPVVIGRANGNKVPVSQGLRAGDRVVVDGVMLLSGMKAG